MPAAQPGRPARLTTRFPTAVPAKTDQLSTKRPGATFPDVHRLGFRVIRTIASRVDTHDPLLKGCFPVLHDIPAL
jgi:hypothetical protein